MTDRFRAILSRFEIAPPAHQQKVIMIGDFGKDLDDEHALVLAAALQRMGFIELIAVVANLEPAKLRAQLARGTISQLGLTRVPVGVGTSCFDGGENLSHETAVPYLASPDTVHDGHHILLDHLGLEDDNSVTLVCNSGLTDAAWLFMEAPDLFRAKVARVAIMGGVVAHDNEVALDDTGFMTPHIGRSGAANNTFDEAAALYLHRACQEHDIPLTILMRDAAYMCQIPYAAYNELVATGNPIGASLLARAQSSIQALWEAAHAPAGSRVRGKLPIERDRAWFVSAYCGGVDPGISECNNVWSFVRGFHLYDPMNLVAAVVPTLRDRFYDPIEVEVKKTVHCVIGITKSRHNVKDVHGLRDFLMATQVAALEAGLR